jgi:hypothetical protein
MEILGEGSGELKQQFVFNLQVCFEFPKQFDKVASQLFLSLFLQNGTEQNGTR